ncbi:MAG: leucine-rich repeat domain-containing protein [Lachnospiraceae bacterium]|nr:leucine-rich repeat domain-containing protein [Lachnospiraceae bacterium]
MAEFLYRGLEDGTNCIMQYVGEDSKIVIPDNKYVSVLFDDLFKGHKEVTEVIIPEGVREIGGFVFDGCDKLTHINLPSTLESMWQYAFTRCGLTEITIPGKVHTIISYAFNQCKDLTTVHISEGTKKIMAWAFQDCTALRDVYVPASVEEISESAFRGCENVTVHRI